MKKRLLAVSAAILISLIPLPAAASEECPDLARPIHVMPFCFTESEFQAYAASLGPSVDPGPSYGPQIDQWTPLVIKYWPAELVPWARAIMKCESGGNEWAKNRRSTAAGLFQFLRSTWDRGPAPALGLPAYWTGAPYVAEWNIQAAAWLYANWGGESQWSCKA